MKINKKDLNFLLKKWKQSARFAFKSSLLEPNPFCRDFIEHGAVCYFNCFNDLENLINKNENKY